MSSTDISTSENEGSIVVCSFITGTENLIQQDIVATLHVTAMALN